ncbi:unnamed protein product, partial [Allacma fusca]
RTHLGSSNSGSVLLLIQDKLQNRVLRRETDICDLKGHIHNFSHENVAPGTLDRVPIGSDVMEFGKPDSGPRSITYVNVHRRACYTFSRGGP